MSRSVTLTDASTHSVDSLRVAFADPDYWRRRLDLNRAGSPVLDTLDTDVEGATTVQFTLRLGGENSFPP